jgi:hypothetical protein
MALQNIAGNATVYVLAIGRYEFSPPTEILSTWFYGGVQFPLATTSGNSLLADADPALYQALAFYLFVLNKYLGPRYTAAASASGHLNSKQHPITKLVEAAVPYNPLPFLQSAQLPLPLMALYRVSGEGKQRSVAKSEEWTTWEFALVLPPMDAAQTEVILPILHAAELLLENRTEQACDATYTPPGGVLGQQFSQLGSVASIHWVSCQYDLYQGLGDLPAPILLAKLLVKETQGHYPGMPPMQGADVALSVIDATSPTPAQVAAIDTWVPVPGSF